MSDPKPTRKGPPGTTADHPPPPEPSRSEILRKQGGALPESATADTPNPPRDKEA